MRKFFVFLLILALLGAVCALSEPEDHSASDPEAVLEEIIPEEETIPENEIISEEEAISEDEIIPEEEVIPEEEIIPEEEVISEDEILPEEVISEDEILPEEEAVESAELLLGSVSAAPEYTVNLPSGICLKDGRTSAEFEIVVNISGFIVGDELKMTVKSENDFKLKGESGFVEYSLSSTSGTYTESTTDTIEIQYSVPQNLPADTLSDRLEFFFELTTAEREP